MSQTVACPAAGFREYTDVVGFLTTVATTYDERAPAVTDMQRTLRDGTTVTYGATETEMGMHHFVSVQHGARHERLRITDPRAAAVFAATLDVK